MDKKNVLIFLLGVFAAGAVFGVISLANKPHGPALPPALSVSMALAPEKAVEMPAVKAAPSQPAAVPAAAGPASAAPVETEAFRALFSPSGARLTAYTVEKGDNLTRIGKKHGVTAELIQRVNSLSTDIVRIGQKLMIPSYRFSAVVDKSQNTLILKGDEDVLKTYIVSTGENNSTPVGVFKATDKLISPTWYKAGAVVAPDSPENVLGTRWIGFDKPGYGIHGTTEPEKLGTQCTAGCVRMRNSEVEELFAFMTPGTEITIVD